jgi:RNA polymerase sigma-70 factor (ECF subfamily)
MATSKRRRNVEDLLTTHADFVRGAIARFASLTSTERDDVFQSVALRILERGNFEGRSALRTWLYRIASNEALAVLRRGSRRRESTGHEDDEIERVLPRVEPVDRALDVREDLACALGALDEGDRAMLLAQHLDGESPEQMALARGVLPQTMRVRLYRARDRARRAIEKRDRHARSDATPIEG